MAEAKLDRLWIHIARNQVDAPYALESTPDERAAEAGIVERVNSLLTKIPARYKTGETVCVRDEDGNKIFGRFSVPALSMIVGKIDLAFEPVKYSENTLPVANDPKGA